MTMPEASQQDTVTKQGFWRYRLPVNTIWHQAWSQWRVPLLVIAAAWGIPHLWEGLTMTLSAGLIVGGVGGVGWLVWQGFRDPQPPAPKKRPVRVTTTHVNQALETSETLIARLHNDITRRALQAKASQIYQDSQASDLHLVVFGMASAGKTSLINALLGEPVGETAPTLGTTQSGSLYTYTLPSRQGSIYLTDTPGLQAIGQSGEAEARQLAAQADLLIFVVAGDLLATEYEELLSLAKLGKRTLLALNKTDQMPPEDVAMIVARLRERTQGVIPAHHVVSIAAQPLPLRIRQQQPDLTFLDLEEPQPADLSALIAQVVTILKHEGHHLRLANSLQQAQHLTLAVEQALKTEQRERGQQIIERMQWATATAVSVTPLPALDLLAAVAIHARMIGELHALYNCRITLTRATQTAQTLAQVLLQLGGVELVTQTLSSLLKTTPVGLIGIPVQAASAAYLTRIAGLSYLDWLESGTPWHKESIATHVQKYLTAQSQKVFIHSFLQQWAPSKALISGEK